jgi:2,4-dienoyl-CoA reductase (NADPH2)
MTHPRQGEYGGSLENRARFSRQVARACLQRVPTGFVLGYRLTSEGFGAETGLDLDENIRVTNWLAEDGIDNGHVSHRALASKSGRHREKISRQCIRAGVQLRPGA